jgi:Na+/H+ antiporter NhaD/arsenite permease-like protein
MRGYRLRWFAMPSFSSFAGPAIVVLLILAYAFVFAEERLQLRKSKPVMVAAGLIWVLVAADFHLRGQDADVGIRVRHILVEYAELFLFLLSATSFVNAMVERNLFEALRSKLTRMRLSSRGVFWLTGAIAFLLSPVADNLTTALVMGSVAMAALEHDRKARVGALVNIVVAANAGGAFSPFGDITTLMIWEKGVVQFNQFFALFFPALVSWLLPAAIISFTIRGAGAQPPQAKVGVRKGGRTVAAMFLGTIAVTILLNHTVHLPPFVGMMLGLGVLNVYSYFLHRYEARVLRHELSASTQDDELARRPAPREPFSIFNILRMVEWDTFLFFYGILFCVGGLAAIGYLNHLSAFLYTGLGNTPANILIGLFSAVIDNIPLTYAVLTMMPHMDLSQWLLMTLATGIGGSLLSIGSAAGVALMGIDRTSYTFLSHLKWSWAILLGYAAGIGLHLYLNAAVVQ